MREHPRRLALLLGSAVSFLLLIVVALVAEVYLRRAQKEKEPVTLEVAVTTDAGRESFFVPVGERSAKPPAAHAPPDPLAVRPVAVDLPRNPPDAPVASPPVKTSDPASTPRADLPESSPTARSVPYARFYRYHATLGFWPASHARAELTKREGDRVIYRVTYTTDEVGRRWTPAPAPPTTRFLSFFGCSYVFGEGVNDDETLPYHAARVFSDRHVYNYGINGAGPQHVVEMLRSRPIAKEIPERTGIAVVPFIHEHINRAIGTPRVAEGYGPCFPWYETDPATGRPVRRGFFSDRPRRADAPYKSLLVNAVRDYHGEWVSRDDADFTVALIVEAKRLFEESFVSEGFYVLLFPGRGDGHTDYVAGKLRTAGVRVLDYRKLLKDPIDLDRFFITGDGHPRSETYSLVANRLTKDLSLPPAAEAPKPER